MRKGIKVWSRKDKKDSSKPRHFGKTTGRETGCLDVEDCTGRSIEVKWPDGELTWCCTEGMLGSEAEGEFWIR